MTRSQLIDLIAAKIAEHAARIVHVHDEYTAKRSVATLEWLAAKFPTEYNEASWKAAPIRSSRSRSRRCAKMIERHKLRECEKITRM